MEECSQPLCLLVEVAVSSAERLLPGTRRGEGEDRGSGRTSSESSHHHLLIKHTSPSVRGASVSSSGNSLPKVLLAP